MKSLSVLVGAVAVVMLSWFGLVHLASAYSIHSGNNVTLGQKKIDDTVYAAGRTIDINSDVTGDIFCAGQNVTITGTVHGDVICAGQNVHVSGTIFGDVRLAGQNVSLGARVTGNATIGSSSFALESGGAVGGDLSLGSGDASLNGKVGRDVVAGNNTIIINNSVGRNVKANTTELTLGSNARVNGNINLISVNNVKQEKGAVVSGKITRTAPAKSEGKRQMAGWAGFAWLLYWLIAMLFTALVLVLLLPGLFNRVSSQAFPRPWKALLTGFVASIVVPAVIVLLLGTLIGMPLAIIVGVFWLLALLLSWPMFAYLIGRWILRRSTKPLLIMLAGAVVLVILYFIPLLDVLAFLATIWFGTGMILLQLFHSTPKPVYDTTPAATEKTGNHGRKNREV